MQNKIIDFERKGNVVRFYLGVNGKQWGDDWDDAPYEHNASLVYNEFILDYKDVAFSFDESIFEPSCGHNNSKYSKNDMREGKVPCLIVIDSKKSEHVYTFEDAMLVKNKKIYYFGDSYEKIQKKVFN